jgi:hypothetical protein
MFFNSKTHIAHLFCFLVTGKTVDDKYDFHVKKISGLIMVCFRSEQHMNTNYFLISVAFVQFASHNYLRRTCKFKIQSLKYFTYN